MPERIRRLFLDLGVLPCRWVCTNLDTYGPDLSLSSYWRCDFLTWEEKDQKLKIRDSLNSLSECGVYKRRWSGGQGTKTGIWIWLSPHLLYPGEYAPLSPVENAGQETPWGTVYSSPAGQYLDLAHRSPESFPAIQMLGAVASVHSEVEWTYSKRLREGKGEVEPTDRDYDHLFERSTDTTKMNLEPPVTVCFEPGFHSHSWNVGVMVGDQQVPPRLLAPLAIQSQLDVLIPSRHTDAQVTMDNYEQIQAEETLIIEANDLRHLVAFLTITSSAHVCLGCYSGKVVPQGVADLALRNATAAQVSLLLILAGAYTCIISESPAARKSVVHL